MFSKDRQPSVPASILVRACGTGAFACPSHRLNSNIRNTSVRHSPQPPPVSITVARLLNTKSELAGHNDADRDLVGLRHHLNRFRRFVGKSGKSVGVRSQNPVLRFDIFEFLVYDLLDPPCLPVEMGQFARTFQPGFALRPPGRRELFFHRLHNKLAQWNSQRAGGGLSLRKVGSGISSLVCKTPVSHIYEIVTKNLKIAARKPIVH
jgi:hypothetical protein